MRKSIVSSINKAKALAFLSEARIIGGETVEANSRGNGDLFSIDIDSSIDKRTVDRIATAWVYFSRGWEACSSTYCVGGE